MTEALCDRKDWIRGHVMRVLSVASLLVLSVIFFLVIIFRAAWGQPNSDIVFAVLSASIFSSS